VLRFGASRPVCEEVKVAAREEGEAGQVSNHQTAAEAVSTATLPKRDDRRTCTK
jgi:hypothetical protein